jgi:hypothetical protein
MITILDLRKDGTDQPQFFVLTYKLPNQGEGYTSTKTSGTEAQLRAGVLKDGGISESEINALFQKAKAAT